MVINKFQTIVFIHKAQYVTFPNVTSAIGGGKRIFMLCIMKNSISGHLAIRRIAYANKYSPVIVYFHLEG